MQTMHPVVVLGSYRLDLEHMPPDEFELRLRDVQGKMAEQGWSGLIAHGNAEECSLITYLTNYTLRLRQALAVVPAEGAPRLLCWSTPRDIRKQAEITAIDDVRMVGKPEESLAAWFDDAGIDRGTIALFDAGNMRPGVHAAVGAACAARGLETVDADAPMYGLMHRKRPREMVMVRRSAVILRKAIDALSEAWKSGGSATDAVLAAEGAAFANEAQDVRTLFSLDGGRTLRPFERPVSDRPERLAAYVALRFQGYWSEGFVTVSTRRNAVQKAASAALEAMIRTARPGVTGRDLAAAAGFGGFAPHVALSSSIGHGIGLSLGEPPALRPDSTEPLAEGGTYSLTVGLSQGRRSFALTSAMLAIDESGPEVLWRQD